MIETRVKPLVTVQLMVCSGDVHLAPRAIRSVMAQDLPHDLVELQIVHDGPASEVAQEVLEEAAKDAEFEVNFFATEYASGYYTGPRNRALPYAKGLYLVFMDADNEMAPQHLSALLAAIRSPDPELGWVHFAYTRREYVLDEGAAPKVDGQALPTGPSPLVPWEGTALQNLMQSPMANFVDTGDMIVARSTLYELAEVTGCVWNSELRRFGDWDLVMRMAGCGLTGRAVDQASNIYHWTGSNLQTTRRADFQQPVIAVPLDLYEDAIERGDYKEDPL